MTARETADGLMDAGIGVWTTPHWRGRVSDIELRDAIEAALTDAYRRGEEKADVAYHERNQVVAALAKLFPSGTASTDIPGWEPEWYGCVYIDLPTGQVSWHYHDREAGLFADLPSYEGHWDGHDTAEKYRRVAALPPRSPDDGWRPIETAPRDGTHFLAYEGTGDMYRAAIGRDGVLHAYCGQPVVASPEPELWRPLPSLPRSPNEQETET